jgi:hypothetical protein
MKKGQIALKIKKLCMVCPKTVVSMNLNSLPPKRKLQKKEKPV